MTLGFLDFGITIGVLVYMLVSINDEDRSALTFLFALAAAVLWPAVLAYLICRALESAGGNHEHKDDLEIPT